MRGAVASGPLAAFGAAALVAVGIRIRNVFTYPADWGFDATFNWQYIYHLTQSWALPPPAAGWSTGDPPFYFYLCAAVLRALRGAGKLAFPLFTIPLLSVAAGLAIAALAYRLVRRADPEHPGRALLAALLLLYLPAHFHVSVMVNEEIVAALFTSLALLGVARPGLADRDDRRGDLRAAGVGLAAGLGVLTKLSGVLAVAAAAGAYALDGWRRRAPGPSARRIGALLLVVFAVAGWYWLRNELEYGYLQPHGLPAHQMMFALPPGERGVGDYLRVPLATWTDPQLLHPDLLHSVWGSTYATLWFDGHRFFLPSDDPGVRRLGTLTLLLALLPSAAFAIGALRGLRRVLRGEGAVDAPLLMICALSLAGYAVYTWQNPWYVVLKGSSLLGLALPYAYYASGTLTRWTERRGPLAFSVWLALAALAVSVALGCTYNGLFAPLEVSGLQVNETP